MILLQSLQNVNTTQYLSPMPIHVNNGLPHICLSLGASSNTGLSVLFDSSAALSSSYLPYHLWTMHKHPDLVVSFECFDDANPFELIKLGGAICHPNNYNKLVHGQLTPIIRYKMSYMDLDSNPIHISFGLGHNMTLNTILGMSIIKDLGMIPNFWAGTVVCEDTTATFKTSYQETHYGFPASNAQATTFFGALPVDQMYPTVWTAESLFPNPLDIPCIDATDNMSQGFFWQPLT
jgi:hypothetical protein